MYYSKYNISMNVSQNKNPHVKCPECDTPLPMPYQLAVGAVIECPACATESECINLSPLTFAPLEQEK